jgi:paraquat-inducible protein B
MTDNTPYRAPEMMSDDELRTAGEKSRRSWNASLLLLVPIIALVLGAGLYWLAATTDTNNIFGPTFAEYSSGR